MRKSQGRLQVWTGRMSASGKHRALSCLWNQKHSTIREEKFQMLKGYKIWFKNWNLCWQLSKEISMATFLVMSSLNSTFIASDRAHEDLERRLLHHFEKSFASLPIRSTLWECATTKVGSNGTGCCRTQLDLSKPQQKAACKIDCRFNARTLH